MKNAPKFFVASHGKIVTDTEPLNDLCNEFGAGVHRLHVDGTDKIISLPEIRTALVDGVFVILGLCEESTKAHPSSKLRLAERNILLTAHQREVPYGIFCRRIGYALSPHLFDANDVQMILTCEAPSEHQLATLRRAYPKAGDPIEIRIPRTDAPKVMARISELPRLAA